jgi:hypothetical protein
MQIATRITAVMSNDQIGLLIAAVGVHFISFFLMLALTEFIKPSLLHEAVIPSAVTYANMQNGTYSLVQATPPASVHSSRSFNLKGFV